MPEAVADPNLNSTDDTILVALSNGRNVPKNLADDADKSRQYIHQRLKILEAADYVRNVGNGVYELRPGEVPDDELERLGITLEDVSDLRGRLQDALEARDDAQARADRLEDELADCHDLLEQARADSVDVAAATSAVRDAQAALDRQDRDSIQSALTRALEVLDDE